MAHMVKAKDSACRKKNITDSAASNSAYHIEMVNTNQSAVQTQITLTILKYPMH